MLRNEEDALGAVLKINSGAGGTESLDWTAALTELNVISLDPDVINDTLGVLLKYQDDIQKIQGSEAAEIIEKINREIEAG